MDFLKIVIDETDICPYLPEQTSRMPLSIPVGEISPRQTAELLAAGYRRSGWFYYRTQCPRCSACEPLRIDVNAFKPSRSQRRAMKLGDRELQITWKTPSIDQHRVDLFNRHRRGRKLDHGNPPASAADYQSFLLNASCEVAELGLWYQGQLVAISIADIGEHCLSAVYCCFDPEHSRLGLGTYAILQQIELGKKLQAMAVESGEIPAATPYWLYLGLYVEQNSHLNYKAKFLPNQRRIDGQWRSFS